MAFALPSFSRSRVNAAGDALISPRILSLEALAQYTKEIDVINNWRSSHSGPLLSMRMLLTRQAESIDPTSLIAQRIKRLSSIKLKSERFPTMKLTQMQDIGGCRAIVGSVALVRALSASFQKSRTKNVLDHIDDYIDRPQSTGYRGIHLIYRFTSTSGLRACNGLKIEVQLRSPLQHAWATAVETVGVFTQQALRVKRTGFGFLN